MGGAHSSALVSVTLNTAWCWMLLPLPHLPCSLFIAFQLWEPFLLEKYASHFSDTNIKDVPVSQQSMMLLSLRFSCNSLSYCAQTLKVPTSVHWCLVSPNSCRNWCCYPILHVLYWNGLPYTSMSRLWGKLPFLLYTDTGMTGTWTLHTVQCTGSNKILIICWKERATDKIHPLWNWDVKHKTEHASPSMVGSSLPATGGLQARLGKKHGWQTFWSSAPGSFLTAERESWTDTK